MFTNQDNFIQCEHVKNFEDRERPTLQEATTLATQIEWAAANEFGRKEILRDN